MTGYLAAQEDGLSTLPETSPDAAPRRVSTPKPDGIEESGVTTTITVKGKSFELTDEQLEEAANRVALEATLKKKPRVGGIAADQLRSVVERIERMESEKAEIASDIKDIYAEAKGNGIDCPTLRKIIALRKQDAAERDEAEHMLDIYARALGMKPQMELFEEDESSPPAELTDEDSLYQQALDIVLRDRKPSPSYVQRMLRIGYNRAAQLVERMESEGIVSAANHVGKREVLKPA